MKLTTCLKIHHALKKCKFDKSGSIDPEGCFHQGVLDCWDPPCHNLQLYLSEMELHLIMYHNDTPNKTQEKIILTDGYHHPRDLRRWGVETWFYKWKKEISENVR